MSGKRRKQRKRDVWRASITAEAFAVADAVFAYLTAHGVPPAQMPLRNDVVARAMPVAHDLAVARKRVRRAGEAYKRAVDVLMAAQAQGDALVTQIAGTAYDSAVTETFGGFAAVTAAGEAA